MKGWVPVVLKGRHSVCLCLQRSVLELRWELRLRSRSLLLLEKPWLGGYRLGEAGWGDPASRYWAHFRVQAAAVLSVRLLRSGSSSRTEKETLSKTTVCLRKGDWGLLLSTIYVLWKLFLEKNVLLIDFSPLCLMHLYDQEKGKHHWIVNLKSVWKKNTYVACFTLTEPIPELPVAPYLPFPADVGVLPVT